MSLRIGVVGAGGFGRAIALASARNGQEVTLWSRTKRELPAPIRSSTDIGALHDCELLFVAVPARHAVPIAEQLGEVVDGRHLMVHVSRGLIGGELMIDAAPGRGTRLSVRVSLSRPAGRESAG